MGLVGLSVGLVGSFGGLVDLVGFVCWLVRMFVTLRTKSGLLSLF